MRPEFSKTLKMKIKYKKAISNKESHLLIPVFSDKKTAPKDLPKKIQNALNSRLKNKDFKAKENEICSIFLDENSLPNQITFLGLGEQKECNSAIVRDAFAVATKSLKRQESGYITFWVSSGINNYGQEIGEGIQLGNYSLGHYQTGKKAQKRTKQELNEIRYVSAKKDKKFDDKLTTGVEIAKSVNLVRDLVNGPANIVNETYFARTARTVAKHSRCRVKVFNRKDLKRMKMGALLGVNHGCAAGAQLITLEYKPSGVKTKPVILVGKGVLFDTGGYNLKSSSGIDTMHMDMAGAALILGVFNLLNTLKIKQHVVGVMPVTQNMIDANAQRPNDIVTSYSGNIRYYSTLHITKLLALATNANHSSLRAFRNTNQSLNNLCTNIQSQIMASTRHSLFGKKSHTFLWKEYEVKLHQ